MMAKFPARALVALVLIACVSVLLPRGARACGPFFTDAVFVFTKHPDFPLENFASGKLGVVSDSWARSYLVVAYRTLSGNPLSDKEATAVKSLWDDRLNNSGDTYDESWVKQWNEARKAAGATGPAEVRVYRNREKPHEYESFLNCQQDAFINAEATLNERVKRFGAGSAQVRDWLSAQDVVFANCGEGRHLPDTAAPDEDALLRADRAYQIAAANFYATNFDEAKDQFDAIARDKQSPWNVIAPYLAARAMLRKASFAEKKEDGGPFLADAETRLNAILNNETLRASHHAARRLLNLVRLRLHPEEKLHELGHSILKRDANEDFKQNVWDYTVLMDEYLQTDEAEDSTTQTKPTLPPNFGSDELTDWIVTFEGDVDSESAHAIERWDKTKSPAWLVAAMATANARTPKLNELLSAAANVDFSSPAFPSLAFHSVRLLKDAGRQTEAHAVLEKVLSNSRAPMPASAVNLFLNERMMLAQNLEEFLQSAPRVPAGFSDDSDGRELPEDEKEAAETARGSKYFFDLDAANVFNKAMPVAMMNDAAFSKTLPSNLRRDVAQAAFLRAALLDDRVSAKAAAPLLADMYPQLKEFIGAYERATTPDARRFAAIFMALKHPGLRPFVSAGVGRATPLDDIDSYRDNYWCTEPPAPAGAPYEENPKPKPVIAPEFLKSSQAVAEKQFAALQALGAAPNLSCRVAIDWANKNPNDPRAPEALHLAVRSTRYGCTNQETGKWSKAAFDLLHSRYPNTTWARNTKYWFKG